MVNAASEGASGVRRRAVVDLAAIVANAQRLGFDLADLRADAYGHGAAKVGRALAARGIRILLDDGPQTPSRHTGPALYGVGDASLRLSLQPTLRLIGEVLSVKAVPAGVGVSYGYTYHTAKPTRLALIGLGFADGVPRRASNLAPVRIGDFTGRVSGRIAMDQFVVDVADEPVQVGDDAVLFGDPGQGDPPLAEWAHATGLPAEAVLARLGGRIERVYVS